MNFESFSLPFIIIVEPFLYFPIFVESNVEGMESET